MRLASVSAAASADAGGTRGFGALYEGLARHYFFRIKEIFLCIEAFEKLSSKNVSTPLHPEVATGGKSQLI